jgi:hypothetical protein
VKRLYAAYNYSLLIDFITILLLYINIHVIKIKLIHFQCNFACVTPFRFPSIHARAYFDVKNYLSQASVKISIIIVKVIITIIIVPIRLSRNNSLELIRKAFDMSEIFILVSQSLPSGEFWECSSIGA